MLPILICKRSAHIHFAQIAHYEENWKGGGGARGKSTSGVGWTWFNLVASCMASVKSSINPLISMLIAPYGLC
jgi:hypothetical protein